MGASVTGAWWLGCVFSGDIGSTRKECVMSEDVLESESTVPKPFVFVLMPFEPAFKNVYDYSDAKTR